MKNTKITEAKDHVRIDFVLESASDDDAEKKATITISREAVTMRVEGYSDHHTKEDGELILLELWEGKFQAYAWTDINESDPTVKVEFDKALIENRGEWED